MTKTDKNSLSAKQLKALPIFASVPIVEQACKQAEISRDCYYEWMKLPVFKRELESLRNELVLDSINMLKLGARKAAATLIKLTGREDAPGVQRAASNDILNHVAKFKEIQEIEIRLSALEEAQQKKG
jgi:hypothetical protein